MSKVSKRSCVVMSTSQKDKSITVAAKADPDAQPLAPHISCGAGLGGGTTLRRMN